MEINKQLRQKVISLIEAYLSGKIGYEEFHFSWLPEDEEIAKDKATSTAIHMVDHFESDQDIMEKDPEYREIMKKQIMDSVQELKDSLNT